MSWNSPREVGPEEITCEEVREFIESDNETVRNLGLAYRSIIIGAVAAIFAAVGLTINPGTF